MIWKLIFMGLGLFGVGYIMWWLAVRYTILQVFTTAFILTALFFWVLFGFYLKGVDANG